MTVAPVRVAPAALPLPGPSGWRQLLAFCLVGASGYAVNLAVYAALLAVALNSSLAACAAFAVAVGNNYAWNRRWTFAAGDSAIAPQAARFVVVSLVALGLNLLLLAALEAAGLSAMTSQAGAVALVAPVNFLGNRLWSFAR